MTRVDLTRVPENVPPPVRLDTKNAQDANYLDVPSIQKGTRYPIEVWQISNGEIFAVVTDVRHNMSLANALEHVVAAIHDNWPGARIIEYWPTQTPEGWWYREVNSSTGGGGYEVDFEQFNSYGLPLKDPRK